MMENYIYYKQARKKRRKIVFSKKYSRTLIQKIHEDFCLIGVNQIETKMKPFYTALNLSDNIKLFCKSCETCINFEINDNPMMQGRGWMGMWQDATSLPNQAPIVSYVLLRICDEALHCRDGTQFLCNLSILAFSLWLLPPIPQVFGSKHLSWSFGCSEATQNTQHLCNPTKLTPIKLVLFLM